MKVPSEYLDKFMKDDALKDKDARHELGVHLDALVGGSDDQARKLDELLNARSWRTFTAGLYQGGVVGCTVTFARYRKDGPMMTVWAKVVSTGAGVAANTIALTGLPYTPKYSDSQMGTFELQDVSAATWYVGTARIQSAFGSGRYLWGIVNASNNSIGINPAVTLAVGDILTVKIETEVAL